MSITSAVGWPYMYGGGSPATPWSDGPKGVDCSGLAQMALVRLGIMSSAETDRSAQGLADASYWVDEVDARKGDLAFYGESWDQVTHVTVILGDGTVLSASGSGTSGAVVVRDKPGYRQDYLGIHRWPQGGE